MPKFQSTFGKCPSCGKRFGIRLTGKKLVKEETVEKKVREVQGLTVGGTYLSRAGSPAPRQGIVTIDRTVLDSVKEFQYAYECKYCGHEWFEIRKEEREGTTSKG